MKTSNRLPNGTLKSQSQTVEEPTETLSNQFITMGPKSGSLKLDETTFFFDATKFSHNLIHDLIFGSVVLTSTDEFEYF